MGAQVRRLEESEEMGTMKLDDSFKEGSRGIQVVRREYILYKFNLKHKTA